MTQTDVFIAGGGIAGLTLAAALAQLGLRVALADPGAGGAGPARPGPDLRSTAYLLPAKALFEEIGLWESLSPEATPLNALRVVDTTGWPPEITETRSFQPSDLGATCFGWNIPNEIARAALRARLEATPGVTLLQARFQRMLTRSDTAQVMLTDGTRLRCRLVVGADGRASAVRDAAGITTKSHRYGQKALAFQARHSLPHDHTSTEIYNAGGAFTTVPLPDEGGQPRSAIVWMNDGPRAQALAAMDQDAFNAEMTARACGLLGPMEVIKPSNTGQVNMWPVITQRATKLVAERTVILAEAAHVLPPIGAQGLNTSLSDVRALFDLVKASPDALGGQEQLDAYSAQRARDTKIRAEVIDQFNRICRSGNPVVQAARRTGLRAAHDLVPLRLGLMRAGLGEARREA